MYKMFPMSVKNKQPEGKADTRAVNYNKMELFLSVYIKYWFMLHMKKILIFQQDHKGFFFSLTIESDIEINTTLKFFY